MDYDFTYTGAEIQAILDTGKKLKDSGYIFLGVATPSTNPGTPTQKVYYEAKQAGTYTNFGGVVLPDGMSLLIWNGSWTSETVMCGDGGVFDISVYKSTGGTLATYADLAAALDGGNNIPVGVRKGGMSVKFVQSSDNNYVQYRYKLKYENTTAGNAAFLNTDNWAICADSVLVECPEYVAVYTDANGKIILAVENDGNIHFGAGVPKQVIDYITAKIAELSLDEYEDIVVFLSDLEKGDKTLQTLLNEKVDKEEGKSLIDEEYASGIQFIENPEFAAVWLDNNEHILFGVQIDGNFLFGCGVPNQIKEYIEQKIADLSLDEYENMVSFLQDYLEGDTTLKVMIDGINDAIENKLDKEGLDPDALNSVQAVENPEFMEIELDADDKILSGRKVDGTKFENNDVELNGNATIGGSLEVDGVVIKNSKDLENRSEITLDAENKVVSYRKKDGTLVENAGIETPNIKASILELSEKGIEILGELINSRAVLGKVIASSIKTSPIVSDAADLMCHDITGVIYGNDLYFNYYGNNNTQSEDYHNETNFLIVKKANMLNWNIETLGKFTSNMDILGFQEGNRSPYDSNIFFRHNIVYNITCAYNGNDIYTMIALPYSVESEEFNTHIKLTLEYKGETNIFTSTWLTEIYQDTRQDIIGFVVYPIITGKIVYYQNKYWAIVAQAVSEYPCYMPGVIINSTDGINWHVVSISPASYNSKTRNFFEASMDIINDTAYIIVRDNQGAPSMYRCSYDIINDVWSDELIPIPYAESSKGWVEVFENNIYYFSTAPTYIGGTRYGRSKMFIDKLNLENNTLENVITVLTIDGFQYPYLFKNARGSLWMGFTTNAYDGRRALGVMPISDYIR